ncbi:MAG TPA: ferredoxin family protein [Burkholderiales bacterium]|nr:ferredoxin family protein [Burkholderiales bacterium]
MTTIVTDNCQACRFTDCVTVCPVACFHGDETMLYIDNEVCIQCSACIPVCPVHAICADDDIPEDKRHWIEINAERSKALPVVDEKQAPLPGAEERKAALGY